MDEDAVVGLRDDLTKSIAEYTKRHQEARDHGGKNSGSALYYKGVTDAYVLVLNRVNRIITPPEQEK